MRFTIFRRFCSITCGVMIVAMAAVCQAHFLWVKTVSTDGKAQAFMYFGESPTDETYHFPTRLAKTKLWRRVVEGKRTEVETKSVDTDDRVGIIGPLGDD